MTYGDRILDLDYGDDKIRRAQNKASSEGIEEYALPTVRSLELNSPVDAEYHAIDAYKHCGSLVVNRENIFITYHIKWL